MSKTPEERLARTARTVGSTVKLATEAVGRLLHAPIDMAELLLPRPTARRRRPGAPPGIEQIEGTQSKPAVGEVAITCIDYGPDLVESTPFDGESIEALLDHPRPEHAQVRWINVDGLNAYVVRQLMERFSYHTLAAEDVLSVPRRPKVEPYDKSLFVVGRMLMLRDGHLHSEQISFFLQPGLLVTFQETRGDVWDVVRERINTPNLKIRRAGADYLLYALLDAMVDHAFPILESYSDGLESLEEPIMTNPRQVLLQRVHRIKRDLALLRRVVWPMRDVMDTLYRDEHGYIEPDTRPFVRDVHDHALRVLDIVETYREMATGLSDLYMNAVSHRMNEVMKVLTIMGTIFIPLSFLAGVYGMNFKVMPELGKPWMYPWGFWSICVAVVGVLLVYFRRKRWI